MTIVNLMTEALPSIIPVVIGVVLALGGNFLLAQKGEKRDAQNKIVNHIIMVCDSLEQLNIEYWSKPNDGNEQMQIINGKIQAHLKTLSLAFNLPLFADNIAIKNYWRSLYRESTSGSFNQTRKVADKEKMQENMNYIARLRMEAMKLLPY